MVLRGDALSMLKTLPEASVQCIVTSPPYWGLRKYDIPDIVFDGDPACEHEWAGVVRPGQGGGPSPKQLSNAGSWFPEQQQQQQQQQCRKCAAWRGQLGQEPTPDLFIAHMVEIFHEARRVLRPDGTCWLNMGDCYAGSWGAQSREHAGKHAPNVSALSANQVKAAQIRESGTGSLGRTPGCKAKDLVGIPWMLAFALRADGWFLRAEIVWAKGLSFCPSYAGSVMPESVTDRPTRSHEQLFLLTKSPRYFYDYEAVKEKGVYPAGTKAAKGSGTREGNRRAPKKQDGHGRRHNGFNEDGYATYDGTRNVRSVWAIGVEPFNEAHFATYPPDLVDPCLRAGTSAKGCCASCGAPWERIVEYEPIPDEVKAQFEAARSRTADDHGREDGFTTHKPNYQRKRIGETWQPTCECDASGAVYLSGDFEIIDSPTGEQVEDDPSLVTGRKGLNRPRGDKEGCRPITRYEQRMYAEQIRVSPHRAEMENGAGEALAHYIRTDKAGARPPRQDLLAEWIERGWLATVAIPARVPYGVVPCTVLDPFAGSGTTGVVAERMRLKFIGIDLGYHEVSDARVGGVAPLFSEAHA